MRASVVVGLGALRANPLRTVLSTLGVVIGVGALVSVLAMGDGVERFARQEIERSTDLLLVTVTPRTTRTLDGVLVRITDVLSFSADDADALQQAVGPDASVHLGVLAGVLARRPAGTTVRGAMLTGVGAVPRGLPYELQDGRWLDTADIVTGRAVALVPAALAAAVGAGVGDTVLLGAAPFRLVGVIAGPDTAALVPTIVPLAAAAAALAPLPLPSPSLFVRVTMLEQVPEVRARVASWLEDRWPDWDDRIALQSNERRVDQARRAMLVFKILMGAVTGVSLVVGGIGIMNVLLASVTERTREIGIRRAAGARRRDVQAQFLAESVAITSVGAAAGAALGVTVAAGVAAFMRAQTGTPVYIAVTPATLLVAAAAAFTVGLVFGVYPALRAGRLAPIDAIRHE